MVTLPCVRSLGLGVDPFANVLTNRTLTVIGVAAFDAAAIWVAPVAE